MTVRRKPVGGPLTRKAGARFSHADPQPVLHGVGEAAEEEWGDAVFRLFGERGQSPPFPSSDKGVDTLTSLHERRPTDRGHVF